MSPQRVQMSRQEPWRHLHPKAVIVARPGKWGNPYLLGDAGRRFPSLTHEQCAGFVVNEFRDLLGSELLRQRHPYPTVEEIRAELGGRDLACWCALDQPCHGSVLLEIANGDPS